ncbi:MAG: flagellar hook-length control protein FliK [Burkholderiaceae bacterium]|nr:flagellar hook-length control protein FliK [Burkholderiaceae bacterium]
MTVTMPAVLSAPKTSPAANGSTPSAAADTADTPSFAQAMQASTQTHGAQPGGRHTEAKSAPHAKLPATDPARNLADGTDHSDEPAIEGASLPAAELAAQALVWAQHTLAQRQATASPPATDTAQNGPSRLQHATGKEVAARLRATDDASVERPGHNQLHDDHRSDADAGRFVLNTQALSTSNAPVSAASTANKPTGAAVSKPERMATADTAARASEREGVILPSPLQQALAVLSKTAAREAADATLGDTARVGTPADLALARESVAAPHEQMPVFHQTLREVATDIVARATLPVPVHHAQWGQAVSEQVVAWTKDMQSGDLKAELRLDPPELGPLRIALTIADGVTSASFASAHASVRHALEQALPQLQAALADAGLSLGNAHVGDQDVHDRHRQAASGSGKGQGQNVEGTDDKLEGSAPVIARTGMGLVDVFA